MKSNKGFTLIETLAMLVVLTIVGIVTIKYVGNTLSVGKNEAYDIMKNNIVSSSYDYLRECNNGILSCDLDWNNEKNEIYLKNSLPSNDIELDELIINIMKKRIFTSDNQFEGTALRQLLQMKNIKKKVINLFNGEYPKMRQIFKELGDQVEIHEILILEIHSW